MNAPTPDFIDPNFGPVAGFIDPLPAPDIIETLGTVIDPDGATDGADPWTASDGSDPWGQGERQDG